MGGREGTSQRWGREERGGERQLSKVEAEKGGGGEGGVC